jgi:hypothetical protein
MQISLHKREAPTIFFKGIEGLTRIDCVSYTMGQGQRPGSDKEVHLFVLCQFFGSVKDWKSESTNPLIHECWIPR